MSGRIGVLENPSDFFNTIALVIPAGEAALRTEEAIAQMMAIAISSWTPDWVGAAAEDHLRVARNWWGIAAGWKIWMAGRSGGEVSLPNGVDRRELDGGVLITSVPGRFDAQDPRHTAAADEVQDLLVSAGLLPARPESEL